MEAKPANLRKLNPKQKRFVKEYLVDLNGTQAAIRAGCLKDIMVLKYYVYFLSDPESDKIFYIGKGSGNRINQHYKNYQNDSERNPFKIECIKRIVSKGGKPIEMVLDYFDDEDAAYRCERFLIRKLRKTEISNISPGIYTNKEKSKKEAELMLGKLKSYNEWVRFLPERKKEQVRNIFGSTLIFYNKFKSNLIDIKENGSIVYLKPGFKYIR